MSRFALVCLALGLALTGLLGRNWHLSNRLEAAQAEASLWEAGALSQQEALIRLQRTLKATEAALVERQSRINALTRRRTGERRHLQEARKHEPVVEQWSRAPVPDAVRGVLKQGDSHGRSAH